MGRLIEDSSGNTSSMRVAMLLAVGTGCIIGLAGAAALYLKIPGAVELSAVGAGMVLGAQGWKYAQTKVERPTVEVRGRE